MKEKRILEALSEVRDEFVEEVEIVDVDYKIDAQKVGAVSRKRRVKRSWVKWLGVAAAFVVVIALGTDYFAPQVDCGNYFSASVTNGMVSLDEEEPLLTKNPFLMGQPVIDYPVYKNLSYVEGAGGTPHYFTEEELLTMAEDVAEKLETKITESTYVMMDYTGIETRSDAYKITAESELAEITILGNGEITIIFKENIILPEENQFSDDNTYVEAMQLIRYLTDTYENLFEFENAADDCRMEYDLTGKRFLVYSAYNVAAEDSDSITEYCFQNVTFYGDENGLSKIHYGDVRAAAEYLGDYAIITEEEARQRLEEGNYVSILTEEDTIGGSFSDENIMLVELTYLTGSTCQYYQPYYCFYVEMESAAEGISNYGTFYVPAFTDEHLSQFQEENPLGN